MHALECQSEHGGRIGFPTKNFPKERVFCLFRVNCIPSILFIQSAIGSRMNGMIFCSFRKQNSSQKNTHIVYSEYTYSGIVPKECALTWPGNNVSPPCSHTNLNYECACMLWFNFHFHLFTLITIHCSNT